MSEEKPKYPYADPDSPGNGPEYRTGKLCIEGCVRPAGTYWGHYWCMECNIKRMDRIDRSMDRIKEVLE